MYCGIFTYAPALALEQVANFQLEIGLDRKVNGHNLWLIRDEIGPSSKGPNESKETVQQTGFIDDRPFSASLESKA